MNKAKQPSQAAELQISQDFLYLKANQMVFNPTEFPNLNGALERLIRSPNIIVQAVIGSIALLDETFSTVFTEFENCFNCRPLTHVLANPNEFEALTPS